MIIVASLLLVFSGSYKKCLFCNEVTLPKLMSLTLSILLGKNFSRWQLEIFSFFFFFPKKIGFDILCKLSPWETICMECQNLFARKNNKKIIFQNNVCWNFYPECRALKDISSRPRWLSWMRRPTGDQEVAGSTPAEVGNFLSWRLIMKYFLRSFSPFRWFKKGSCQFLAKECAQHWLTA